MLLKDIVNSINALPSTIGYKQSSTNTDKWLVYGADHVIINQTQEYLKYSGYKIINKSKMLGGSEYIITYMSPDQTHKIKLYYTIRTMRGAKKVNATLEYIPAID